jgi:acetyl esterase/lipase
MTINRRSMVKLAALAAAPLVGAAAPLCEKPDYNKVDTMPPGAVVDLWPGGAPGSEHVTAKQVETEYGNPMGLRDRKVTHITHPTLTVFPALEPKGPAIMLAPGGGYERVVVDKEGFETARWLARHGVTAFVLLYRLPGDNWAAGSDVSLSDAQRGLRIARASAAKYHFDPKQVGAMGFSAGGHLISSLMSRYDGKTYEKVDAADDLSARPDFATLFYPSPDLGKFAQPGRVASASGSQMVTPNTPLTFLCQAQDDPTVPVQSSIDMFEALHANKVPVEMHIFQKGGHGFGLRSIAGRPTEAWPELYLAWLRTNKIL